MVPDGKPLFELIGSLYEAAAAPERWEDFLRVVSQVFACDIAVLTLNQYQQKQARIQSAFGLPPEANQQYNDYYGARNPAVEPVFEIIRKTGFWIGLVRSLVNEEEYKRGEYYNDFGRKYGTYWAAYGVMGNSAQEASSLSVARPEKASPLGPDSVELMALLLPHLKGALKIHQTMQSLRSTAAAAVGALDAAEAAVVAVNGRGEVVLTSEKAEAILRHGDGISLRNRRLSATDLREARELDALILSAADTGAGRGLRLGGAMLLHRRARRPLQITVVPFRSSSVLTEVRPCAVILISDPDALPASRTRILASLYQLTPAECRLADLLLQGLNVATAAECMKITTGTARFMLKCIFGKTGTHRQSELMRFLLGMPGVAA